MLGHIVEDRYLVEAELGEGAMGRVYRAKHVKVGRQVAIKVMHRELARVPAIVERFAREARIAARLNHPNLIGVLDVGMTPDRLPLIVLELAPGQSLFRMINGPMPRERVVRMVRQLLLGLDHAHAAGLVHRDLKPDNILVETTKEGLEIPRIVDFGIAVCTAKEDAIASNRLTEVNTVIGTPAYMSPEQAMAKDLDARTDLYSLGIIMYEMLAGMTPFDGSGVDVAVANASRDVPPIAVRSGVMVDPLLEAFVRTLCARKANSRFQSARDALIMLDKIESGRIEAARLISSENPNGNTDQLGTHRQRAVTQVELRPLRRPARVRAFAGAALAFAAMTAFVGWSFREAPIAQAAVPSLEASLVATAIGDVKVRDTVAELVPPSIVETVAPVAAPVVARAPAVPRIARKVAMPVTIAVTAPAEAAAAPAAAPAAAVRSDTASALATKYVEVGQALRGASDELWARYRLIRINDALKSDSSRREALAALTAIQQSIVQSSAR